MTLPDAFFRAPLAHRALHGPGRRENSLSAVKAAVAAGYGIEVDVQPSIDGVAMVFHDYALGRLTEESGSVAVRSAAELRAIPLKGTHEGIPTLFEVLEAVDGRVPILIEIKDQDGAMGPNVGLLQTWVGEALTGYRGPVAVMSFNPHTIAAFGAVAPDVPRGLTTSGWDHGDALRLPAKARAHLAAMADFDRVGAQFISHDWRDLDRARVRALKAKGVPVLCWTIRSPAQESQAREIADNITFEGYAAAHPA
jgi:glycerophosphoryl diester phosphodiesterase